MNNKQGFSCFNYFFSADVRPHVKVNLYTHKRCKLEKKNIHL